MATKANTNKSATVRGTKKKIETKVETPVETKETNVVEPVIEKEVQATATTKKKITKFDPEDLVLCQSVASGITYVRGIKSGELYMFESRGAEEYIQYRDLVAAINNRSAIIFKPFIMVLDQDFINEQKRLKDFYESMYTPADFEEFFRITPKQMKEALDNMPEGIKDTIKSIAATKIEQKTLDSVQKIKLLDEYFGTKLMLLTGLYDD